MKRFITKILTSGSGLSSRRLIALLCVPPYLLGGVMGVLSPDYRYFLTSMICTGLLICVAFFSLDWRRVAELTRSVISIKTKTIDNESTTTEATSVPMEQ